MLEIEIIDVNEIDGGVEIFAKAFNDAGQIGFGKTGTVDIERFIIKNPPILVEDADGDIVIKTEENIILDLPATETRYREDPEEATIQALEQTIAGMKNRHDDSSIIVGKVGNTTETAYASVSAYMFNSNTNFATLRADGTSVGYNTTSTSEAVFIGGKSGSNYLGGRDIYHFDTSAIPDTDDIDSAVFSVKFTGSGQKNETTYPANGALVGVTGTPDEDTSDFGKVNETRYADTDVLVADVYNTSGYADWTMNATGLADISKTGTTYLGLRPANQFSDSTAPTARSYALGYYAASSGTTNDPKLVVEHSAGGGGATDNALAFCNF